jgi:hypothetical protein
MYKEINALTEVTGKKEGLSNRIMGWKIREFQKSF